MKVIILSSRELEMLNRVIQTELYKTEKKIREEMSQDAGVNANKANLINILKKI